ncbi:hypothetical protein PsYK624_034890 [Phanerochaete sordida]|uniref:Uncharacterized protein n=1 Tax=Phanerochaete sordida TaxID=48140 RepID=A0A9P3G380_9APHY|nr:hypothetical protein PsYK624_034890 [Phanerochaete sordida]
MFSAVTPAPLAPGDISLSRTEIAGFWVEGPLCGLSIALYIVYIRLFWQEPRSRRKAALLGLATVQVLASITHYIAGLTDLIAAFVIHINDSSGADGWFSAAGRATYLPQYFCWATTYIIADALMAWRCWVIWSKNRLLAIVFITLCIGQTAITYVNFGFIASAGMRKTIFSATHAFVAIFALSLALQISATTLIAWRLLHTRHELIGLVELSGSSRRLSLVWMVIESGAILTSATLAVMVLFILKFQAGAMMIPIITQLSFLVPTSVIVRAMMKKAAVGETVPSLPLHSPSSRDRVILIEAPPKPRRARGSGGTVHSLASAIVITTTVETDAKVDDIAPSPAEA